MKPEDKEGTTKKALTEQEIKEKIKKVNIAANLQQRKNLEILNASGIDFAQDENAAAKANELISSLDPIGIYYDKNTGIGFAKKSFHFILGEDEANVFSELFEHINQQVDNKTILKLLNKQISFGGTRSDLVKEFAKRLRQATGLSSHHLTAKKGTLTLIGKKLLSLEF